MLPPMKDVRMRSIRRWMQDQEPARFRALTASGELESALEATDKAMIATYEELADQLLYQQASSPRWGTPEATAQHRMDNLMLWQEVVAQYLPVTSSPDDVLCQSGLEASEQKQEQPVPPASSEDAVAARLLFNHDKRGKQLVAEAALPGRTGGLYNTQEELAPLFRGSSLKSSQPGFNPEKYERAKPHFEAILAEMRQFGFTLKDLFRALMRSYGKDIKPYALQFARDEKLSAQRGATAARQASVILLLPIKDRKMIPPMKDMRIRSIRRWMQDQQPARFRALSSGGELESALETVDKAMMDVYGEQVDQLLYQHMTKPEWGTPEATAQFRMDNLLLWQEVVAQYLPAPAD